MVQDSDPLTSSKEQELSSFRRSKLTTFRVAVGCLALVLISISSIVIFNSTYYAPADVQYRLRLFVQAEVEWIANYNYDAAQYADWLSRHGLAVEQRAFDLASQAILINASHLGASDSILAHSELPSLPTRLYISLHFSLLRISFLILASWRLLLAVGLIAWYIGSRKLKVYSGLDILGETSNGRIFFSGTKIGLDRRNPDKVPDILVTGLACPATKSPLEVSGAPIGRVLSRYSATNGTNLALAGVLLAHGHVPAYIDQLGVPSEVGLAENATDILERGLEIAASFRNSEVEADEGVPEHIEAHNSTLQATLLRVLRPQMREALGNASPALIATLLLAAEVGKCLAYRNEGGRWIKRSIFPHLSSRAVLHSIPSFATDYTADERRDVRCALVFASRSSPFGAVRFPIDLPPLARAMRQWTEVLLADPKSQAAIGDDVELHGLVYEIHRDWSRRFIDGVVRGDLPIVEGGYVAQGRLFYMPLEKLAKSILAVVEQATLRRLEELIFLVHQRQRLLSSTPVSGSSELAPEILRQPVQSFERILTPFGINQVASLAATHKIGAETVQLWSSLRVVLNSFGWLGRRVGDYSVPDSSLVLLALRFNRGFAGANANGFLGLTGMVPLRSTRLFDVLGEEWRNRYTEALSAAMAEDQAGLEKLLAGKEPEVVVERVDPGQVAI